MKIEIVDRVTDELTTAFARLMPQLSPGYRLPERSVLEAVVASQASTLMIARDEAGCIVGTLTLAVFITPAQVHAWIEDVVVDEAARGQGIGEALTSRRDCPGP